MIFFVLDIDLLLSRYVLSFYVVSKLSAHEYIFSVCVCVCAHMIN